MELNEIIPGKRYLFTHCLLGHKYVMRVDSISSDKTFPVYFKNKAGRSVQLNRRKLVRCRASLTEDSKNTFDGAGARGNIRYV